VYNGYIESTKGKKMMIAQFKLYNSTAICSLFFRAKNTKVFTPNGLFGYYTTTSDEYVVQVGGRVNLDSGDVCHTHASLESAVATFDALHERLS
jgi:hypothetical protein